MTLCPVCLPFLIFFASWVFLDFLDLPFSSFLPSVLISASAFSLVVSLDVLDLRFFIFFLEPDFVLESLLAALLIGL